MAKKIYRQANTIVALIVSSINNRCKTFDWASEGRGELCGALSQLIQDWGGRGVAALHIMNKLKSPHD